MKALYKTLCALIFLPAAQAAPAAEPWLSLKSQALETWGYGTLHELRSDSLLNPENGIAQLPQRQLSAEGKLNLVLRAGAADITLRPVFSAQRSSNSQAAHSDFAAAFKQAYIRSAIGNTTFSAGRQLLTWGPAYFRSPGNPFYFDAGRTDPLRELPGLDMARVVHSDGSLGLSAAYIAGSGALDKAADFARTLLLKADWQGNAHVLSLVASKTPAMAPFLGAFGQQLLSDELLLYGEYGYGSQAGAISVDADSRVFGSTGAHHRKPRALLGAAYTLENGQTLALEYLYNGFGLNGQAQRRYFDIVSAANRQALSGRSPAVVGAARATLGTALARGPAPLARDTLFLLWQSNPAQGAGYWRLSWSSNLNDRSGQLSAYAETPLSDQVALFCVLAKNHGARRSEYGALTRSSALLGVKVFWF